MTVQIDLLAIDGAEAQVVGKRLVLDVVGVAFKCGAHLVVKPPEQTPTQAQLDAMKSRTIRIELSDL